MMALAKQQHQVTRRGCEEGRHQQQEGVTSSETQLLNPSSLQVSLSLLRFSVVATFIRNFFQPFFPPCDLVWAPYLLPQPMQQTSRQQSKLNFSDLKMPPRPGSSRITSSTRRIAHEAGATAGTRRIVHGAAAAVGTTSSRPAAEQTSKPTRSSLPLSLPFTHIQVSSECFIF